MSAYRQNAAVTRAHLNGGPGAAPQCPNCPGCTTPNCGHHWRCGCPLDRYTPERAGSLSRFTDPAPSPATRAALERSTARIKAQRAARAAQGRCTECGRHGHTANRCSA